MSYAERVQAGICAQCDQPVAPDSDRCPPHRDAQRERDRKWQASRAKAHRDAKPPLCARCGVPSESYYCPTCVIRRGRAPRHALDTALDKQSRIDSRTKTDSTGRRRYHGRTRNQPQRDDADALAEAIRLLHRARNGLALAHDLSTVQRRAAMHAAMAYADRAARIIAEICVRVGYVQQALVP